TSDRRLARRARLADLAHRGGMDLRGECWWRRATLGGDLRLRSVAEVALPRRTVALRVGARTKQRLVIVLVVRVGVIVLVDLVRWRRLGGRRPGRDDSRVAALLARVHHEPAEPAGGTGDHRALGDAFQIAAGPRRLTRVLVPDRDGRGRWRLEFEKAAVVARTRGARIGDLAGLLVRGAGLRRCTRCRALRGVGRWPRWCAARLRGHRRGARVLDLRLA